MSVLPRVHILLPVHNRRSTTERFIDCLNAQTYRNWHLVLIDDGSTDGTEAMVRGKVPDATVLKGAGNWWWGGSLHQGYKWLKRASLPAGDIVLTMNDDTEFDPDFLARGVAALKPRSLLAQQYYLATGEFCEAGVDWNWRTFEWAAVPDQTGINCFPTRGLFLQAGDFLEIGGFHPILLPHYLSDYEFTQRAHRKGFALITDPLVFLRYDEKLTGVRKLEGDSVWQVLGSALSIKSTDNPFYWTSFVMLASPARYVGINIVKVWWRFFLPVIIAYPCLATFKRRTLKLWALLTGTAKHRAL